MCGHTSAYRGEELIAEKNKHNPGDTVEITFIRNGEEMTVKLTLGKTDPNSVKSDKDEEEEAEEESPKSGRSGRSGRSDDIEED